jgi:hypothetical protein
MRSVSRWCHAVSRHIPTNWGPQKMLVAIADHCPVATASVTPY